MAAVLSKDLAEVRKLIAAQTPLDEKAPLTIESKWAGRKLTAEVRQQAQMLLNKGLEVPEVGRRVGILANTLHKAIRDGRLVHNIRKQYF